MADIPDNEKIGRWTEEEHNRFLRGLELYGKKWTKVADVVGTRTTVQVRSHAQKYFQKLGGKPGDKKGDEEDDEGASPSPAKKAAPGKAKA